jgi:DNA segregation ATPase FtsK/SpoIIIE, S-DNA-T family
MATRSPSRPPARKPGPSGGRGQAKGRAPQPDSLVRRVRGAVAGHEDDLVGLVLLGFSLLLGFAIYADLAGPVGSWLADAAGAVFGLGRYGLPPLLAVVGIAFVADGRNEHRGRLAAGMGVSVLAILGLLHVALGPDALEPVEELRDAGGWVGAVVGQPLQSVLGIAGACVVLAVVLVGALLVTTRTSLRTAASAVGSATKRGLSPAVGAARKAIADVSTLSSQRGTAGHPNGDPGLSPLPPPSLYDVAKERPDGRARETKPKAPKPAKTAAVTSAGEAGEQLEIALGPGAQPGKWKLPPLSLLHRTEAQEVDHDHIAERGRILENSLASHGVETRLVGMTVGPTVTRYELELGPGVKVARVTSAPQGHRLRPGGHRRAHPRPHPRPVGHRRGGAQPRAPPRGPGRHPVVARGQGGGAPDEVAIGKDIAGRSVLMNLTTTPHLLIAGATGAGKSSGINCIITTLLMRTTPEQVRLILIDPKQVEMGQYDRLPHLLTQPVTNPKKAANALSWACREMDRRYDLLAEVGFRDITGYNASFDRGELVPEPGVERSYERLPYILVVVDELNDLMMVAARDVEDSITRIAQKARAVGIHLIVATQRPSVNVITGVIKANVPPAWPSP